ncbi:MAG: CpaE family protein [Candidatus Limnocylindrales bacterium]
MSTASTQIRLLLVEDVPEVARYIRGLLNSQSQIRLLDVVTDGRKVAERVKDLRPDVMVIDSLLQGKVRGLGVAAALRAGGQHIPTIVLAAPPWRVVADTSRGVDHVLAMPFTGFDMITLIKTLAAKAEAEDLDQRSSVYAIFSPKGGVGKTTIAFNVAVALQRKREVNTLLVDGNLQFGDVRALLGVPADAPSILELPADRITDTDLADVVWHDPSGIDALLAPPRIELHEMVSARELEKTIQFLRRIYPVIVVDTPADTSEKTMAFLDSSDFIIEVITHDAMAIHSALEMADLFRALGTAPAKVHYLVNRAEWTGGIPPTDLAAALGRAPRFALPSGGNLVAESNNRGVPFVIADPAAPISVAVQTVADGLIDLMAAGIEASA